ncbi:MAG: hypothetical protein HC817_05080 [Saprospiraceae bacterium]|nr:hypothetical protein [Saprospiraceae bacterium]
MEKQLQIKSESQYERILERVFSLTHKKISQNSAEARELEWLTRLIEAYEHKFYPLVSAL